ncbi:MAG TPA: 30S ribosomal protein S17 [Anaerolineales bacterium]|nr:30S ribosomal protein S17 [Anaerolineales bacterium]
MNKRRRLTGVVVSANSEKTVMVEIERTYLHPLYKKVISTRNRLMVHDEMGCQVGDHVRIVESRPISKRKSFIVEEILRHEILGDEPVDAAEEVEV